MFPLCFSTAFLLPATQINPATNRKITAQNYCPPCQLGKLPSSRISTDILALRAQNLQQLGASPDQNHSPEHSVPFSQQANSLERIQQAHSQYHSAQQIPQCIEIMLTAIRNGSRPIPLAQQCNPRHPSLPNGAHSPLFPSLIPPCRLTQLLHNHPPVLCPSSLH
jgi:hypothetical protein